MNFFTHRTISNYFINYIIVHEINEIFTYFNFFHQVANHNITIIFQLKITLYDSYNIIAIQ